MMGKTNTSTLLRLHFIVFLWGFTAIIGKLIATHTLVLVFYRMLFAAFFLFLICKFILKISLRVPVKPMLSLMCIGGVMMLHWLLFFYSIKVSNVSIALSCMSLSTLFAAIIEPIVFRRKVDWQEIVLGVIIVLCISFIFGAEIKYKWGILSGIVCALLGTIFSVFNGRIVNKIPAGIVIFYEIFSGWAWLLLYFLLFGSLNSLSEVTSTDLWLLLFLGSIFTAYPMLESVNLMRFISPFTLILTVNLEPIYGVVFAYFIFGESEKMTPIFYIAAAIMILSIFANGILKERKRKVSSVKAI